ALVGHDDPPDRVLLAAHAGEPQSYCERKFLSKCLEKPTGEGSGRAPSAPAAHQRADVWHLAPPDLAHELAHLVELLDQLVDRLHVGTRSLGDAQAPRALDELGPTALLRGHGEDDRLDTVQLALVDLHVRELVAG